MAFSCSGQTAVVGSTSYVRAGVVYVYGVSAAGVITYQAKLSHSISIDANDRLGGSAEAMSMTGNLLVVGMSNYETSSRPCFAVR